MKKRVNKNLPLVGFRENIERDDATQNVTFETDGSVDTRPGLKEVILPEDPRYVLSKVNEAGDSWATGSRAIEVFYPLFPPGSIDDGYKWSWVFEPDGDGSSGTGIIKGYDETGTVVISTPGVINAESNIVFLSGGFVLPAATRGAAYDVDLIALIAGGTAPYKVYKVGDAVFFGGTANGQSVLAEFPALLNVTELPNRLTTSTFQWIWSEYAISLIIQDSSSPKKSLVWTGTIPVTVSPPVIVGKDAFNNIDLGTITVGVPFTHTFTITGGLGTSDWKDLWGDMIPALPGITLNRSTGVLSGTLTSETGKGSGAIQIRDLYLGSDIHDGAALDDYAWISWKTTNFNPPVLEVPKANTRIVQGQAPCDGTQATIPLPTTVLATVRAGTGTAPFTYTYSFGTLPTTILLGGIYWIRVSVVDALGLSATLFYPLVTGYLLPCPIPGPYATPPIGSPYDGGGTLTSDGAIPIGSLPGTGPIDPWDYTPVPPSPPRITSTPTITATAAVAYSYAPAGSGGTFTAALLPTWLTFSGGILSGTPAVGDIGNAGVALTLTGPGGVVSQSFNIVVASASGGDPAFTSTPITVATTGIAYIYSITTSGTQAPFVITAPTKPAVLTITDNGDGTATLQGTFGIVGVNPVQLLVTDNIAGTNYQNFDITVS